MSKPGKNENRFQDQGQESMAGFDHTGAYLRKLRTEKGLSIQDASEATRISEINLAAMENQDFASLPAETFTRGLLTNYARYLGADPAHVVTRFMREREQKHQGGGKRVRSRQESHRILTPKKLAEPAHISSITMAAVLLLCIVILFTGVCLYTSWNPFSFLARESDSIQSAVMHALPGNSAQAPSAEDEGNRNTATALPQPAQESAGAPGQPAPEALEAETSKNAPEQASAAPTPPASATAAAAPAQVTIEFLKDTNLVLTSGNDKPVQSLFKKGEKRSWPLSGSMQLTFDQAESAVILVNGQKQPFPEEAGGRFTLNLQAKQPGPPAP